MALLVFLIIRLIYLASDRDAFTTDPDAYLAIAKGWAETGIYGRADRDGVVQPTAFRSPLFTWLVSWAVYTGGSLKYLMFGLHLGLGAFSCLLSWLIGKRLFEGELGHTAAWLASIGVACDPILLHQSALIMTETTAAFVVVLVWFIWLRLFTGSEKPRFWKGMFLGMMLGLAILVRASYVVWLPMILVLLLIRFRFVAPTLRAAQFVFVFALIIGLISALAPWAIRNRIIMGHTIFTTSHGGYTLLLANNPVLYDHFDRENLGRTWDEEGFHQFYREQVVSQTLNECDADRIANQIAWETIESRPASAWRASFARFAWFWALWPKDSLTTPRASYAIGGYYAILLVSFLTAIGMGFTRNGSRFIGAPDERWIPGTAILIGLTMIHLLYWSNMRMRGPIMPVVYLAAVIPWLRFAKWYLRT